MRLNGQALSDLNATHLAKESAYAGIVRLVEEAQGSNAPMSRLADRWSLGFLAVTVAIAFAAWWFTGEPIGPSPCWSWRLVDPGGARRAGGRPVAGGAFRCSSRGPAARDDARIRTLILDKTGTLTDRAREQDIFRLAAALEQASQHPVARAIVVAAKARGLALPVPSEVAEIPGEGVVGSVAGHKVIVGGEDFVAKRVGRPTGDHSALAAGSVLVAVAVDGFVGRASDASFWGDGATAPRWLNA